MHMGWKWRPAQKPGTQFFTMDPVPVKYAYIKVIIQETFGASMTYMNQVFLLEENPMNKILGQKSFAANQKMNESEYIYVEKDDRNTVPSCRLNIPRPI